MNVLLLGSALLFGLPQPPPPAADASPTATPPPTAPAEPVGDDAVVEPAGAPEPAAVPDGWTDLFAGGTLGGWSASPADAWAAFGGGVFVAAPSGEEVVEQTGGEVGEDKPEAGDDAADDVEARRAELTRTGEPLPDHCELAFEFAATDAAIVKVRLGAKGPDRGFVYVGFPDLDRKPDWWAVVSSYQPGRDPGYRRFNLGRSAAAVRAANAQAKNEGGTRWHRVRLRVVRGETTLTVNGIDLGGGRDADLTGWTRTPHLIVERDPEVAGPAWARFRNVRVRPLTADGAPAP